jgi:hypothetical protein
VRWIAKRPLLVPSPRPHHRLLSQIPRGERVRVRGNRINRGDSECPSPPPSPRRKLVSERIQEIANLAFGSGLVGRDFARPQVRGYRIQRNGLAHPSPPPSPRANALIQLMFPGGEREPVEAAITKPSVRTPNDLPRAVPSPRRKLVSERNQEIANLAFGAGLTRRDFARPQVRGYRIYRGASDYPSPPPSPRTNYFVLIKIAGVAREPFEAAKSSSRDRSADEAFPTCAVSNVH